MEQLYSIRDLFSYVGCLHENLKHLQIFIVANNTPCGPFFSHEKADELREKLGLGINLAGKFRMAYIAIIDGGEVLYEKLAGASSEWLEVSSDNLHVVSGGFESSSMRNTALIEINGRNYSENKRGLNFVVFDKETGQCLDACSVDTYVSDFVCVRTSDIKRRMKGFCEAHPGVHVACFNTPAFPTKHLTRNETFLRTNGMENGIVFCQVLSNLDTLIDRRCLALMEDYPTRKEIDNVLTPPESYLDVYGVRKFKDFSSQYVNTGGGIRVTTGQPPQYDHSVFVLGGCLAFGVAASDDKTISSYLQSELNKYAPGYRFIVHNYGYYLMQEETDRSMEMFDVLESLPVRAGDIVLILHPPIEGIPFVDMSNAAKRPHKYGEVFFCVDHYTPAGYRMMADKLYEYLEENKYFQENATDCVQVSHSSDKNQTDLSGTGFDESTLKELNEYKASLREIYDSIRPRIGAIVMNCNPFTKGHRYLIEEALKRCSQLVVFIVQEDRSIFSFQDRIRLVKEGVKDLRNVTVVPSGRFIISSLTFREYFNKSECQEQVVDTSEDVSIFAREIAPCLNISVRFVGEEPIDRITRQYNDTMKAILPQYGIEVVEVPRKKIDSEIISASKVRELLEERQWKKIEQMVPKTTLNYLKRIAGTSK